MTNLRFGCSQNSNSKQLKKLISLFSLSILNTKASGASVTFLQVSVHFIDRLHDSEHLDISKYSSMSKFCVTD